MENSLKNIISELAEKYDLTNQEDKVKMIEDIMNLSLVRLLNSLVPVITNIMTLAIPRLLFMISLFSEHKIITFEQQTEVIRLFADIVKFNPNLNDEEFSKKMLETVLKYKEQKNG